jgi:hypothetical protein
MASGLVWSGNLPAASFQDTGAVAGGNVRTANINVVNYGTVDATLRVYISTSASPTDADRVEPDLVLKAGAIYKLTGEPMSAGERVVLFSSVANVAARVSCFEEVA